MNPVQIARGIAKTSEALVSELKLMSREVSNTAFLLQSLEIINIQDKRKQKACVKSKMYFCRKSNHT